MADYPYVKVQGNLKKVLATIQSTGVPAKFTTKSLEVMGFKSSNDRPIIGVLKFIGFIDDTGTPTELWRRYRNKDIASDVFGQTVKSAYDDLFSLYPDAHLKEFPVLRNYFSVHTSVGEQALTAIVRTFKSLCELSTFEQNDATAASTATGSHGTASTNSVGEETPTTSPETAITTSVKTNGLDRGLAVNINIELHLPSTNDGEVYDKLFDALKRHLLQS